MKQRVWIIGLAALLVSLAIGGTVWAVDSARPAWLKGQVSEIGAMSITVRTRDGEVEVLFTEDTTLRIPGVTAPTKDDIQVGSHVLVRTEAGEEGILTARAIVVLPPRRLEDRFVRGTVTAVDEAQVSVETGEGAEATLLITEDTHVWIPGQPPTTTVQLTVGDPVLAAGEPVAAQTSSKAISARLIVVATDEDLPKFAIQGRTVTVTEETIVVKTKRGERAITVRPQTRLWSDAGRLTSLHDVHPGEQIIALGQPTEIGQWIAGLVVLPGAEPLANLGLRGQVVERDAAAGTLLVKTKERGQITVITNEETSYRIPGIELPALEDIQVGDQIVAIGRFQSSDPTTFMARGIGVIDSSTREDES